MRNHINELERVAELPDAEFLTMYIRNELHRLGNLDDDVDILAISTCRGNGKEKKGRQNKRKRCCWACGAVNPLCGKFRKNDMEPNYGPDIGEKMITMNLRFDAQNNLIGIKSRGAISKCDTSQ